MDDPLSAVDAAVRKKLIANVMLGCLRGRTRILVTHAIDFLPLADKVILMKAGRITAAGTYHEIKSHPEMQALIKINKLNADNVRNNAATDDPANDQAAQLDNLAPTDPSPTGERPCPDP